MSLILEPSDENITWFVNTMISEYLLQNKSKPNYKNLKWIISDFDENKTYSNMSEYYNNTINMQVDYYISSDCNNQIKRHFFCKVSQLLKKLFFSEEKLLCDENKSLSIKLMEQLKNNYLSLNTLLYDTELFLSDGYCMYYNIQYTKLTNIIDFANLAIEEKIIDRNNFISFYESIFEASKISKENVEMSPDTRPFAF